VSEGLKERLRAIENRISGAALRAGRKAEEIKLIPVSKTHPVETLREAIAAGINCFGENKGENLEWHLIGHLQANKARKAVKLFDVIHSLDSVELAERLERICKEEGKDKLEVLAQVDLAGEETKAGIPESELPELVEFLRGCKRLKFTGLMILPPYFETAEEVRPYFRRLREIRDGIFSNGEGELSMGMTHDFEIAVEEGATMVRVGTAIFGERNYTV
jgi:pyridoxal phosphate enzyme (YggS family)